MEKVPVCVFSLKEGQKRILWEITNKCNVSCKHCCSKATKDGLKNELGYKRLEEIATEIANAGFNQVYFTGGEPLLKEHFIDLLTYVRDIFNSVIFVTNGLIIDKNIADSIAKTKVNYVCVSIDSISPCKHNKLRNFEGLYEKACETVKLLLQRGVPVRVSFTITNENYNELESAYDLAKSLNANALLISYFWPVGYGSIHPELTISNNTRQELEERLQLLKERVNVDKSTTEIKHKRFGIFGRTQIGLEDCPGGVDFLYITANGKVGPCPWVCKLDHCYTSFKTLNKNSFREVYSSEEIYEYRKMVSEREKIHNCKQRIENCGHGCPALAKVNKGSYMKFDPFCEVICNV